MAIKIAGTGSYLPEKIVTNVDLEKTIDTSDEWIRERTGIGARHVATEDESVAVLGAKASLKAIEAAGCKPEDIDIILAATCSSKDHIPSVACQIQSIIDAPNAAAIDIGAACTGFLSALTIADAYINSGAFKKALVVGSEVLSGIVDWSDRGTCILFGDGAGAAVVEAGSNEMIYTLGADGYKGDALTCKTEGKIEMNGQAVFKFATRVVPDCIEVALKKAGLTVDDIDTFVLHQANARIIEFIAKRLKQPIDKFPMNLENNGNTSSASIPVLLDELVRAGKVNKGDKLVLSGFGAGLTYGACILTWE